MSSRTPRNASSSEALSPAAERPGQPRKTRKGTSSCWACKRRKVRCSLATHPGRTCTHCRRRGSVCVGQDVPEELAPLRDGQRIDDRIVRVEALVNSLAQRVDGGSAPSDKSSSTPRHHQGIPTPTSTDGPLEDRDGCRPPTGPSSCISDYPTARSISTSLLERGNHREISRALLSASPSQREIHEIFRRPGGVWQYMALRGLHSGQSLAQHGPFPPHVSPADLELLTTDTHPVLIAHQMLSFAMLNWQRMYCEHGEPSEPPIADTDRMVNLVTALVTTNEEFHTTVEMLQCMVMESAYHLDKGRVQQSWRANRRAMLLAQQMGVHRSCSQKFKSIDPRADINREIVWFRILYFDRFFCLILGFPQGSIDTSIASGPAMDNDEPLGRLDRAHAAISARLLERMGGRDLTLEEDHAMTHAIDAELLRAAKAMPPKFWLQPSYHGPTPDPKYEFLQSWRGMSQVIHYNLINQLHLPQLLRFKTDGSGDYSKLACMNANREVLVRYISYRSTSRLRAQSCLTFDFLTLMAAITLLLAHLDSHLQQQQQQQQQRDRSSIVLEHQRLCDRTMLEQVLATMGEFFEITNDVMSESGIKMLQCLLRIEEDAAEGGVYSAQCIQEPGRSPNCEDDEQEGPWENRMVLRISIPYFGIVKIVREGICTYDSGPPPAAASHGDDETPPLPSLVGAPSSSQTLTTEQTLALPFPTTGLEELQLQQYWNPSQMTGTDDWVFQGIDVDFFDSR